eukprot:scaffold1637_cov118-Skeletonema_dohrnii-CCMP3373.AAC.1
MEPAATSKDKEQDDGATSNRIVFCGITLFIIHNGKQRRARAQMTRKKRKRKPSRTFSQMKTNTARSKFSRGNRTCSRLLYNIKQGVVSEQVLYKPDTTASLLLQQLFALCCKREYPLNETSL